MNPIWNSRYITENEKMLNKGERSGGQLAKRRLMFNSWLAATIRPCCCNFRLIQDIVRVSSFFLLEFILLSYQRSTWIENLNEKQLSFQSWCSLLKLSDQTLLDHNIMQTRRTECILDNLKGFIILRRTLLKIWSQPKGCQR